MDLQERDHSGSGTPIRVYSHLSAPRPRTLNSHPNLRDDSCRVVLPGVFRLLINLLDYNPCAILEQPMPPMQTSTCELTLKVALELFCIAEPNSADELPVEAWIVLMKLFMNRRRVWTPPIPSRLPSFAAVFSQATPELAAIPQLIRVLVWNCRIVVLLLFSLLWLCPGCKVYTDFVCLCMYEPNLWSSPI